MAEPKEVKIYNTGVLCERHAYYLSDLRNCYECGKVCEFTYKRLLNQYYKGYT